MGFLEITIAVGLLALFGGSLAYQAISGLRAGVAQAAGTSYRRTRRPAMFWLAVVVQLMFSGLCFAVLVVRLLNY
jgi:hypothetical protein